MVIYWVIMMVIEIQIGDLLIVDEYYLLLYLLKNWWRLLLYWNYPLWTFYGIYFYLYGIIKIYNIFLYYSSLLFSLWCWLEVIGGDWCCGCNW